MFSTAVNDAKGYLTSLKNEIDHIEGSISASRKSKLKDLHKSLHESLETLSQLAHDYDAYNLQLFPEDVDIPNILTRSSCKIGGGSFGYVYESVLNGSKVAVKVTNDDEVNSDEAKRNFKNEIKILRLLRHDNIVAFRGSGFLDNNQRQFVVMELIKDNLHGYIHARPGDESGISAFLTWHINKQVGNALLFLHSNGVTHGDIKPDNILLDLTPVFPRPKLCDFGVSWKTFGDIAVIEGKKGHVRYRTKKEEDSFKRSVVGDVLGLGLVIMECRTGKRPWDNVSSQSLIDLDDFHEYSEPTKSKTYWKIRDVKLTEVFGGELGEIVVSCCGKRLPLDDVMKLFDKENPYKAKETEGEFFSCGFLTNTNIYVVDSIVEDETDLVNLPAYRPEDLICDVALQADEEDYIPEDALLKEKYYDNSEKFKKMAKKKIIDDNPMLALKRIITDRAGEEETQKISLSFIKSTYVHHRAMRDVWREFDEVEKNEIVQDKNHVNKLYSTSFGLHVAILTNEGEGKRKFVFTQRSNKKGVASPGAFTCGAVESCSVKDFLHPATDEDETAQISLINTAARGLAEELGLKLSKEDKKAINLNTTYLKFDNHEWGMCGFVDLTDKRISEENQWSFQQLNSAFTSGPKDHFEHSMIYGIDFDLKTMVEWIRANHNNMASSGKIVVVKVLDTYFGTAAVTKEFETYM